MLAKVTEVCQHRKYMPKAVQEQLQAKFAAENQRDVRESFQFFLQFSLIFQLKIGQVTREAMLASEKPLPDAKQALEDYGKIVEMVGNSKPVEVSLS